MLSADRPSHAQQATKKLDIPTLGTHPPKVLACPLLAIQSDADRVWPVELVDRWGDLAGAGFRPVRIRGVPHYKLVSSPAVWEEVVRELASAAMAHSQSVEITSDPDDF